MGHSLYGSVAQSTAESQALGVASSALIESVWGVPMLPWDAGSHFILVPVSANKCVTRTWVGQGSGIRGFGESSDWLWGRGGLPRRVEIT